MELHPKMTVHIIFDFDGTLWNCKEAYLKSVEVALNEFGIKGISHNNIVVGLPIENNLRDICRVNRLDLAEVSASFRSAFTHNDPKYSALFPNVISTLQKINERGYKISIASFKRQELLSYLVKLNFPRDFFSSIVGSKEGENSTKINLISECLGKDEPTFYVGDTQSDKEASAHLGIDFIYAAYGYQELTNLANNIQKVYTVDELLEKLPHIT
jgi:phosphoglycolate phosphatase